MAHPPGERALKRRRLGRPDRKPRAMTAAHASNRSRSGPVDPGADFAARRGAAGQEPASLEYGALVGAAQNDSREAAIRWNARLAPSSRLRAPEAFLLTREDRLNDRKLACSDPPCARSTRRSRNLYGCTDVGRAGLPDILKPALPSDGLRLSLGALRRASGRLVSARAGAVGNRRCPGPVTSIASHRN